ncbi:MAG: DUF1080 domain-containing protein [Gemmataceae bacterium]|nr:DUF1080 domain-containing protein [Gemmataceae bacterium]MDW8243627.1 DUF1080 domain-containing protein [Thermogemmata sp.]
MKAKHFVCVAIAAWLVAVSGWESYQLWAHAKPGKFNKVLSPGDIAPAWENLEGTDGRKHSWSDLKDKDLVVVVFTCNSCPVAVAYEERLKAFASRYTLGPQARVALVAINVNTGPEDALPAMQQRARKQGFNFPYLYDPTQQIARRYGAVFTPEVFVLDKERRVVYTGAIDDRAPPGEPQRHYLREAVDALLAGKPVTVAETSAAAGCRIKYHSTKREEDDSPLSDPAGCSQESDREAIPDNGPSVAAPFATNCMQPIGSKADSEAPNTLSEEEKKAGWRLLFDGRSTTGWRGYRAKTVPTCWKVENGSLLSRPQKGDSRGDLITIDQFDDFELRVDWKMTRGGNSGIIYRATEEYEFVWQSGPEYQILDNQGHLDGLNPLASAGACYAVFAPAKDVTRPLGEWNQTRILARGSHVEHWLNGEKLLEYDIGSNRWLAHVKTSKFFQSAYGQSKWGRALKGHIGLQDYGGAIEFRNIKVRSLSNAATKEPEQKR